MDSDSSPIEPLAKRTAYFRRLFARGIGRTPTALQRLAITTAARAQAKAEAAALDPATSANDFVRLTRCAALAKRDMEAVIGKREPAHVPLRIQLQRELEAAEAGQDG